MLAPGHLAAGYLTAKIILKIVGPELSSGEFDNLLLWGILFGLAPDLDISYNTIHPKKKTVNFADCRDKDSHRGHFTHAPLVWLAVGLLIFFWGMFVNSLFLVYLSLLLWICSWVHFGLDSLEDGIRWLWPFDKRFFRIKNLKIFPEAKEGNFFKQYLHFFKNYTKKFKLTFYLEIVLVLAALTVYFLKV